MIIGNVMVIGNYHGMDWFHPIHFTGYYSTSGIHVVRGGEIDMETSSVQAREHMARIGVEDVEDISSKTKTALGKRKPQPKAGRNSSF